MVLWLVGCYLWICVESVRCTCYSAFNFMGIFIETGISSRKETLSWLVDT